MDRKWEPFAKMNMLYDRKLGIEIPVPDDLAVFKNNLYQVMCRGIQLEPPWGRVLWLSIKRIDRGVIHDWRDLQRIKNELAGPEIEAIEIYPSEDNLVDTSNQYHLWAFVDGFKMPFGYRYREVMEHPELEHGGNSAVQRPFYDSECPDDVKEHARKNMLPACCDWGNCNEPAVDVRRSDTDGWLPVCEKHRG